MRIISELCGKGVKFHIGGKSLLDEIKSYFWSPQKGWRKVDRIILDDPQAPKNCEASAIDPYAAWLAEFNQTAREIDPGISYAATSYVPEPQLAALFKNGVAADDALYRLQTNYRIGGNHGYRLDGHGRNQGYLAYNVMPRHPNDFSFKPSIMDNAQGVFMRLAEQAKEQLGRRRLNVAREGVLTKFKPLPIGLAVALKSKTGRKGTITDIVESKVDKRPMYEVVLDDTKEIVHARAIELFWKGRTK